MSTKRRLLALFLVVVTVLGTLAFGNSSELPVSADAGYPNILEYEDNLSSSSYVISSPKGLAYFGTLSDVTDFKGKYIYLTCDLDMAGVEYTPFSVFAGYFDGMGHSIKNISIQTKGTHSGIFGNAVSGSTIRCLGVEGGTISAVISNGEHRVGSIVGCLESGTLERCWSTATVTAVADSSVSTALTDISVGGIVGGGLWSPTIRDCYFAGTVNGVAHASGICDWAQGHYTNGVAKISNCLNFGTLNAEKTYPIARYSGSILEANKSIALTNCYFLDGCGETVDSWTNQVTKVSEDLLGSGELAYLLDGGNKASHSGAWKQGELFPEIAVNTGVYKLTLNINAKGVSSTSITYVNAGDKFSLSLADKNAVITSSTSGAVCDGQTLVMPGCDTNATVITSYPNITEYDSNSSASAFVITNASGFTKFASVVNAGKDTFENKSVYLLCNVDLGSVSNFTPIGTYSSDWATAFKGSFYGNDHKVLNLNINLSSRDGAGLFGAAYGATFNRLGIYNGSVTAANRVGGIAGYGDASLFEFCYNGADITSLTGTDGTAGLSGVARSNSVFNYCFNFGDIKATVKAAAGIAGWGQTNITLKGCYNVGKITSPDSVAALVRTGAGYSNSMNGCYRLPMSSNYTIDGSDKNAEAFSFAETAWLLNTAGGTESNSCAYTSTPFIPAIASENSGVAVKFKAVMVSEENVNVDSKVLYGNAGDSIAIEGGEFFFAQNGATVPETDGSTNVVVKIPNCAVNFVTNGGSFDSDSSVPSEYKVATGLRLPDSLTKNGYFFAGWYESEKLDGEVCTVIQPYSFGDKTYYAKWSEGYPISNASEYMAFANAVNGGNSFADKYAYLTNNIDFNGAFICPVGTKNTPFCGVFDGKGFGLKNFDLTVVNDYTGVFGYIDGAVIKNLNVYDSTIKGGSFTGSVVGYNKGGSVIACASNSTVSAYGKEASLGVMSFNIRIPSDATPNTLAERSPRVKSFIQSYSPDIVGMQEVTPAWKTELDSIMSSYSSEFVYRATSSEEAAPLYWKTGKFTCLEQGTFWLSSTPDVESLGWDGGCYRTCSYAALVEKTTGHLILFFNTHLDHKGEVARAEGSKLVASRMQALYDKYYGLGYRSILQFCTGDFNAVRGSQAYHNMTNYLSDTVYIANQLLTPSSTYTFTGYSDTTGSIIDYIFTDGRTADVVSHKVANEKVNGYFISDHYGLYDEVSIRNRDLGGIVGFNEGTVVDCAFIGEINGTKNLGGVVGENCGAVWGCYGAPVLNGTKYLGSVVGINGVSNGIKNCYGTSHYSAIGNSVGLAETLSGMNSKSFSESLNALSNVWIQSDFFNGGYPFNKNTARLAFKSYGSEGGYLDLNGGAVSVSALSSDSCTGEIKVSFNGNAVTGGNVGTGYTVGLLRNDTVVESLTVVIKGDVDSDGLVNSTDAYVVKSYLKKLRALNSVEKLGAEFDADGEVTTLDYIKLKLKAKNS